MKAMKGSVGIGAIVVLVLLLPLLGGIWSTGGFAGSENGQPSARQINQRVIDGSPASGQTDTTSWTVLVYMCADNDLEYYANTDFNEMERIGSSDSVNLVVEVDGAGILMDADGLRYYVVQDTFTNDQQIRNTPVADLGEINTGDPATLVSFVQWAVQQYPANRYALLIWDHGNGWHKALPNKGNGPTYKSMGYDFNTGVPGIAVDSLGVSNGELDTALTHIELILGKKIDLVGFDACMMHQWEVLDIVADHADYSVGSQDVEAGNGWWWDSTMYSLKNDPGMNARELGGVICRTAVNDSDSCWIWWTDPPPGHWEWVYNCESGVCNCKLYTMSCVDLSQVVALTAKVDTLALELLVSIGDPSYKATLDRIRLAFNEQEHYVWGDPAYIDLHEYADSVNADATLPSTLRGIAGRVMDAVDTAVTENRVDSTTSCARYPTARGVGIFYPYNQDLCQRYDGRYDHLSVAGKTHWDDFVNAWFPSGHTLVVKPEGTGSYATIQAAIDAAHHRDTILLSYGIFKGPGNRGLNTQNKAIVIASQNGPEATIIDCENLANGFTIGGCEDSTTVIRGVTIQRGIGNGAGISISWASPIIEDCVFRDYGSQANEVISIYRGFPILRGCVFYRNSCAERVVYVENTGPARSYIPVEFVHCTFSANTNYAVRSCDASVLLDNCIVTFTGATSALYSTQGAWGQCFQLSCCDLYGNNGGNGDWVGCIADQLGQNGNMSKDPKFCDTSYANLKLLSSSPCLPDSNPSCGLIGARGEGCCDCSHHCDLNGDGVINPLDLVIMDKFVYQSIDERINHFYCPGYSHQVGGGNSNGDWNCSGAINPVDFVRMVNYVYRPPQPAPCNPCNCAPYPTSCPPWP